jgi:fatty-acyl-CoA synthase
MIDRLLLAARLLPALPRMAAHRPSQRKTVADWIEDRARRHPQRTFVIFEGRRMAYGELDAAANRVAHFARRLGLGRGDAVALLMENRPEYVATWAGLAKAGVTTALLNTNQTGRALRHSLAVAGAKHLILGSECADAFASTAADLERPVEVWWSRDPTDTAGKARPPEGARDLGAILAEQPALQPDPGMREGVRSGDDLFYIYTSGTTGLPKAARFSHMRFMAAGDLSAWALGLGPESVHYCALPLYHSAGGVLVVSSVLAAGATMALRRKFSASQFWDDCRRFGATSFQYIGEFCRYLLNQPEHADDREHRVRAVFGNGLRGDIWPRFQERFGIPRVIEFYGATEGNATLVNLEGRVGAVGRFPFKFMTNARLVRFDVETESHERDARGLCIECRPGEVGEFIGRIPSKPDQPMGRFEGYTSPEATEKKILRDVFEKDDQWFRSGDLLRQDADGFFYFVDRIGDTFRWKGENVSTQEVAGAVSGFGVFEMVNVYGVKVPGADGRAGMAAVLLREGVRLEPESLWRHLDDTLPRYAAPLFLRELSEVEVTGTFKLRKVTLQEEGFDVARVSDPIWLRDDEARSFVRVTPALLGEIRSGARRL